jgi:hypothetical protein
MQRLLDRLQLALDLQFADANRAAGDSLNHSQVNFFFKRKCCDVSDRVVRWPFRESEELLRRTACGVHR